MSLNDKRDAKIKYWEAKDGEHRFLEDVNGEEAISWVKEQNSNCLSKIGDPKNPESESYGLYKSILSILDSKDKIPHVTKYGDYYYNFWQDENHPRGLYRRTNFDSYKSSNSIEWETVLDVDELGKLEGESWVYKGISVYHPEDLNIPPTKALVSLSRGGADASVVREFDLSTKSFVDLSSAFFMPEAKSSYSWVSENLLLIGTDLHDGKSLTDSGYPRTVREWKRGTKLEDSTIIFEGESADVSVRGHLSRHGSYEMQEINRSLTFYTSKKRVKLSRSYFNSSSNVPIDTWVDLVDLPNDAELGQFQDRFLINLRSSWTVNDCVYPQGALLSVKAADFAVNGKNAKLVELFRPTSRSSLTDYTRTKSILILQVLENVKERLVFFQYQPDSSDGFILVDQESDGAVRGSSIRAVDDDSSDLYWFTSSSFINPSQLFIADALKGVEGIKEAQLLKSLPAMYDSSGLVELQFEATSTDGTKVPYFFVCRGDMPYNSDTPTLLYGYGGFEISLTPTYSSVVGHGWLQRGGAFAYANIRGGGEFGPEWHQAALKANRQRAYDDFIAIAEDLVARKITSPKRLGIRGGSNGGLLMGNMIVQRPDLFGAVVCAVPLLDMRRYNVLLAGASWMAEYGNPDIPEDWEFLRKYSAYHNIDSGVMTGEKSEYPYPPLLMTTSTRDDRVHPYHARAFVRRLNDLVSHSSGNNADKVLYYENMEGGHGGAADNPQQAFMNALYLEFLWKTIGA